MYDIECSILNQNRIEYCYERPCNAYKLALNKPSQSWFFNKNKIFSVANRKPPASANQ